MSKRLYFDNGYWDSENSQDFVQLWRTNGTDSGTKPILTAEGSRLGGLIKVGGRLFFTVGNHLWKSDGTTAGTKDMGATGPMWPRQLVDVGGTLCFIDTNWDAGTWSLWESEGTASTTYSVKTFVGVGENWEPQQAAVGSRLFFAADDGTHGAELWSYTP
jgi:ELWxxDGT repeat protein